MSARGHLIRRALDLDFQLEKGFSADLSDTPADEFLTLKLLQIERNAYDREQSDKQKNPPQR